MPVILRWSNFRRGNPLVSSIGGFFPPEDGRASCSEVDKGRDRVERARRRLATDQGRKPARYQRSGLRGEKKQL